MLKDYASYDERTWEEYDRVMAYIKKTNQQAFHTEETLMSRKFFHCPVSPIPYQTCYVKAKNDSNR